jgi:hypothetical protein
MFATAPVVVLKRTDRKEGSLARRDRGAGPEDPERLRADRGLHQLAAGPADRAGLQMGRNLTTRAMV